MRYFNKYLSILIILFFSIEKARTETINEISNQLNDIKESISQLESASTQEESLIDKSLLEMTRSLDFINQNIDEGKIDIAISAINFTDKIIKDISSTVIPKDIQTEVVDKKIEYSPEQLAEIIEITNGMQVSKKENELNLAKDVIKIQNNGFSAFEIAENLKDNGINTIDVKNVIDLAIVNKVAEPEILNEIINDAAKIYELNQKKSQLSNAILKSVSKEQATGLLKSLNQGEEMEAVASQIVNSPSATGFSSFSVSEILNEYTDKAKGAEILKSALDDIVDPKLVSIGRHRQYLKDWDVKIFSDGSREIIATPQELEEAANISVQIQKESQLSNEILKSVSKEQATGLLKSLNQGEEMEAVASQIVNSPSATGFSSFSVSEILNEYTDKAKGAEILKSALDDIVDPKLVSIGRHRQYLKDWDVKIFSDGSREIIATPQELEEAAKEFKVGEQKRDLKNTIRKSMSGEEARQLLQSINQGNVPTSVAGLSVEVTESVAETTAEVTGSVADTAAEVTGSVAETAAEVTESVAETAAEVTGSVAETAAEVTESVAETAAEVAESVAETAAEVAESISVEEIAEALQEIVGNSTGELGITGVGRHRGLNSAGELVDQVAIFRSDGSMEVCTETGDMDGVSSRGGC